MLSQLHQLDLLPRVVLQLRHRLARGRSQQLCWLNHLERRLLEFLGLDEGLCKLDLGDLVFGPDAVDDLVFVGVDELALALLQVVGPLALVLRPVEQIDLAAVALLAVALELALVVLGLVDQLPEPVELTFLEFADVLHVVAPQVPEPVRLAVPQLALVAAIV